MAVQTLRIDGVQVSGGRLVPPRLLQRLSLVLALAAGVTGFVTYTFGGFLVGSPVMNGSARGTALVMFLVGVPVFVISARRAFAGSTRALFVWAGMSMYLTYNSFMLLTATPINRLFLLYIATFGLALATMIGIATSTDVAELARHCAADFPTRPFAVYLGFVVVVNAGAWLVRIVPATIHDSMSDLVDGMAVSTVPTYLQDLAFWLPLVAIGAWLLWQQNRWGYLISGASLAFWALEAATVAVDQWFGHRADPSSDVASNAVVFPFAVLAAVGVTALWSFLRHTSSTGGR